MTSTIQSLQISAKVTNLKDLTFDAEQCEVYLQLECLHCDEKFEKMSEVDLNSLQRVKGRKSKAHFVARCWNCGRKVNLNCLNGNEFEPYIESGTQQEVAIFEGRGVQIVEYYPYGTYTAVDSVKNKPVSDIEVNMIGFEQQETFGEDQYIVKVEDIKGYVNDIE